MHKDDIVVPPSEALDYEPKLVYNPADLTLEGCLVCCGKCMKFLYK